MWGSLVLIFFNILTFNELNISSMSMLARSKPRTRQQRFHNSSLQGSFGCSNREFHRSCVYCRLGQWDTLQLRSRYVLIHENWFISSSTSPEYFLIDFKANEVHCKLQNYIYLLPPKNCGIPYVGESITPVVIRINIQGKKVAKFPLPIIRMFVKMQRFQFFSLK